MARELVGEINSGIKEPVVASGHLIKDTRGLQGKLQPIKVTSLVNLLLMNSDAAERQKCVHLLQI